MLKPKIIQFIALLVGFATMMTVDLLSKLTTRIFLNTCGAIVFLTSSSRVVYTPYNEENCLHFGQLLRRSLKQAICTLT